MKKIVVGFALLGLIFTASSCGIFGRNKCNCPHFEAQATPSKR